METVTVRYLWRVAAVERRWGADLTRLQSFSKNHTNPLHEETKPNQSDLSCPRRRTTLPIDEMKKVHGPVKTQFGYHLIRIVSRSGEEEVCEEKKEETSASADCARTTS